MDATREDFVPRARSKAACCQAWAFFSFAATILCALLYIAWAVYAAFLFSESVAVFSACIVYIIFYFGTRCIMGCEAFAILTVHLAHAASPADINRRLAIWLASHSQPIWMIRVAIQWNNALVLVGVAFACCYTSPLAAFLRSAGGPATIACTRTVAVVSLTNEK